MTDKEILEKAAKAAGIEIVRFRLDDPANKDALVKNSARNVTQLLGPWNPLTDDGDALRLAVKLNLQLTISPCHCDVYSPEHDIGVSENDADTSAATRLAITKAAAAIGEAL